MNHNLPDPSCRRFPRRAFLADLGMSQALPQLAPLLGVVTASITRSRLKLPGFMTATRVVVMPAAT